MTDNELIAEFMGHEFEVASGKWCMQIEGSPKGHWLYCNISDEFKYSTSWDWLMPVVEKIGKMENELDEFYETTDIKCPLGGMTIFAEKQWVYAGVIEFIRWYNSVERKETK